MSYKLALEKLKAHEPKRLAWRSYCRMGIPCAIGAIAPSTRYKGNFILPVCRDSDVVAAEIHALGLSENEAEIIQLVNDQFLDGGDLAANSPRAQEDRYAHVLAWLEAEVAKESP